MSRRRGTASVAASPVLIGAATVLVALVAVFIAYNANAGLPFVPTYEVNAELPSGGKLVKGNEVRVGGFRVGVVKELTPKVTTVNGERRGEGQPEAGPLPGQRDLSKPQIVLPPAVQDLLDSMSPQEQRQLEADDLQRLGVPTDEQTTGQLLDYLLAP